MFIVWSQIVLVPNCPVPNCSEPNCPSNVYRPILRFGLTSLLQPFKYANMQARPTEASSCAQSFAAAIPFQLVNVWTLQLKHETFCCNWLPSPILHCVQHCVYTILRTLHWQCNWLPLLFCHSYYLLSYFAPDHCVHCHYYYLSPMLCH